MNIDAQLVREGEAGLSRPEEKLVEFSNGCICCTLREDLLKEVCNLAEEGRFDYLLIESTGKQAGHSALSQRSSAWGAPPVLPISAINSLSWSSGFTNRNKKPAFICDMAWTCTA